jgi:hypothetical protein
MRSAADAETQTVREDIERLTFPANPPGIRNGSTTLP